MVAAPDLYGECIHPLEGVSEASTVPERLASLGLSFGCSSRLVQGQREQKTETNGSCGPGRCNRLQPPDPQGYPHARQEEGLCDVWGEAHEDCEGVWSPNRVWLHHLQCSSLQGDVFCRIPSETCQLHLTGCFMSEQSHTQQAIRNKILSQHFLFTFVLFNDFVTDGFQNGQ